MSTTRSKFVLLGVTAAAGAAILGLAGTALAQSPTSPNPAGVSLATQPATTAGRNEGPETGNEPADGVNESDAPDPALVGKAKVTEAQATAAALKAQPDGKVIHTELQDEDGTIVWGVELSTPNGEHDVKIDASTGAVLKNEADNAGENGGTEASDTADSATSTG